MVPGRAGEPWASNMVLLAAVYAIMVTAVTGRRL